MPDFFALEPAIDPSNRMTFLLDWEITMKCNLDCSYCRTGIYGGHDNSTQHPSLEECKQSIDFMFEYVDIYMQHKPKWLKHVALNVYGGEALHHPNIVEILEHVHKVYSDQYLDRFSLCLMTTTNIIITEKKLKQIIPLISEFTVSYHSESSPKQKEQFKSNVLAVSKAKKTIKCIILMHPDGELFTDSKNIIEWCKHKNIRYLPRQLDHTPDKTQFNYGQQQVIWFDDFYKSRRHLQNRSLMKPIVESKGHLTDLSQIGRSCCGGRSLCHDQNYKDRHSFVDNKFPDWYCSVDEFFLYVKQINGEIFTNKDCKMNFQNQVGPIGNLSDTESVLQQVRSRQTDKNFTAIQCKKTRCLCGLCAPKAKSFSTYQSIMDKYRS